MKRIGPFLLFSLLGLLGCDNTATRLDKSVKPVPKGETPAATPPVATKVDRTGSVEDRLARLEDNFAKYSEELDFLAKVYANQKQQQQQQARNEPSPDAVFAVDIAPNVKAGLVEGPAGALVTIVEAWDFA
jgi:hypothetical protein